MAWEESIYTARMTSRKTVIYRATFSFDTFANNDDVTLFSVESPYGGKIRYLSTYATAMTTSAAISTSGRFVADDVEIGTFVLCYKNQVRATDMAFFGGAGTDMFSSIACTISGEHSMAVTGLWGVTGGSTNIPLNYEREVNWEFMKNFRLVKYGDASVITAGTISVAVVYDIGRDI